MTHTAAFCRAQQASHAKRAADSGLDNVRAVAIAAAAAWGQEAEQAERRESRRAER